MKGLELSKRFYQTYGAPMLEEQFPALLPKIAVGLLGSGSECFGYDDETSQDHDFEPGFCLVLPDEETVDRKESFRLERAYAKLPKEFLGFSRSTMNPVGGNRHGVIRLSDLLKDKTGTGDGNLSVDGWFRVPEYALAELTNGEIFYDESGLLTSVRERLAYYPDDVRLKKLAGHLLLMAQAGQYNYHRCLSHGETAAAQLAVNRFAESTMQVIFLLNRVYMPYYKWSFRALRSLPKLSNLAETLEFLLTTENAGANADTKVLIIEDIASMVINELQEQTLTQAICGDLEKHAYSVNDHVADPEIRNRHILFAI